MSFMEMPSLMKNLIVFYPLHFKMKSNFCTTMLLFKTGIFRYFVGLWFGVRKLSIFKNPGIIKNVKSKRAQDRLQRIYYTTELSKKHNLVNISQ